MKTINTVISGLLVLLLASCSNYLDVKPQGKVIPETDEEYAAVVNNRLQDIEAGEDETVIGNSTTVSLFESYTDNLDANITAGKLAKYAGDKINIRMSVYSSLYAAAKDCDIIIEKMSPRESDLARSLTKACYAIKAICYYNLMREFCEPYDPQQASSQLGVPLVEKFDMEAQPLRSDLESTGAFIVKLFEQALAITINDPTYVFTDDVVKAYLAKAYFWMQEWEKAADLCEELLAKPEYALAGTDTYADVIQARYEKKTGIVFRSYINNSGSYSDWNYSTATNDTKTRPVSKEFVDLFPEKSKDVRYAVSFDDTRANAKTICSRVRASELCLMLAECYAHTPNGEADALAQLNLLRSKRIKGVTDYTLATLPEVDADALIKTDATGAPLTRLMSAILTERRKELYMEGDRWFELKRNGRPEFWIISSGMKYTTRKYLYTAPIPRADVELIDGLIQNEGYVD